MERATLKTDSLLAENEALYTKIDALTHQLNVYSYSPDLEDYHSQLQNLDNKIKSASLQKDHLKKDIDNLNLIINTELKQFIKIINTKKEYFLSNNNTKENYSFFTEYVLDSIIKTNKESKKNKILLEKLMLLIREIQS